MDSGTTENLKDIWGPSSNSVYAVGSNGTFLIYNGYSWSIPMAGLFTFNFNAIWVASVQIFSSPGSGPGRAATPRSRPPWCRRSRSGFPRWATRCPVPMGWDDHRVRRPNQRGSISRVRASIRWHQFARLRQHQRYVARRQHGDLQLIRSTARAASSR